MTHERNPNPGPVHRRYRIRQAAASRGGSGQDRHSGRRGQRGRRFSPGTGRHHRSIRARCRRLAAVLSDRLGIQNQPAGRSLCERCLRSLPGLRDPGVPAHSWHLVLSAGGPGFGGTAPRPRQPCHHRLRPGLGNPGAIAGGIRAGYRARLPSAGLGGSAGRRGGLSQDPGPGRGPNADGAGHRRLPHRRADRQHGNHGQVHPPRQCRSHGR